MAEYGGRGSAPSARVLTAARSGFFLFGGRLGYVYFVEIPDGPIKVGIAKNVKKRLETIRTHCPYEIRLLAAIPGGRARERELHAALSDYRMRGEWFAADARPVVLEMLADARDALICADEPEWFWDIKREADFLPESQTTGKARFRNSQAAQVRIIKREIRRCAR